MQIRQQAKYEAAGIGVLLVGGIVSILLTGVLNYVGSFAGFETSLLDVFTVLIVLPLLILLLMEVASDGR